MCQTIYISEVCMNGNMLHERVCVNAGHTEHSEVFANGEWKSKN